MKQDGKGVTCGQLAVLAVEVVGTVALGGVG